MANASHVRIKNFVLKMPIKKADLTIDQLHLQYLGNVVSCFRAVYCRPFGCAYDFFAMPLILQFVHRRDLLF